MTDQGAAPEDWFMPNIGHVKPVSICPDCNGLGVERVLVQDNDVREYPCGYCNGKGVLPMVSPVRVELTPERIKQLRALCEAACHEKDYLPGDFALSHELEHHINLGIAARNALPEILDEIERLRAKNARLCRLEVAAREFCLRVETGEIMSRRSYRAFKAALDEPIGVLE